MSKVRLRVEVCAWSAGLLCASVLLITRWEARGAQQAAVRFGVVHANAVPGVAAASSYAAEQHTAADQDSMPSDLSQARGIIGRLDVPALGLSVPILNDYDPASLRRGVGRMPGTALPGGLGNLVLAGHRDTYFRPLRRVRPGMILRVVTQSASYDYTVDSTSIVLPEDVSVLDIGDRPEMTLITCYPFDFIGAAPKRFIVHTHLLSVAGEPEQSSSPTGR